MAQSLEEYKRLFREATVADQNKLFNLHVGIWAVVNLIWLGLNMMGYVKVEPSVAMYFSPVGWGLLVVVHYWFYVRGAENLCKLREDMVEAKGKTSSR
jgi:hypothetical protein